MVFIQSSYGSEKDPFDILEYPWFHKSVPLFHLLINSLLDYYSSDFLS